MVKTEDTRALFMQRWSSLRDLAHVKMESSDPCNSTRKSARLFNEPALDFNRPRTTN